MSTPLLPSRALTAWALGLIPTHRQIPQPPDDLLSVLAGQTGATEAEARAALSAALAVLDAFNGLTWHETAKGAAVQMQAQLSTYFSNSLQMALANSAGLRVTPELLRLLEQQRLDQSAYSGVPAAPTREQTAVLLLIVQRTPQDTCLLHQFDQAAGQYQLIGGRLEPDETVQAAAWRELQEEIGISQPSPLRIEDMALRAVLDGPFDLLGISATYGALTHYTFFAYQLILGNIALALGPFDRWISVREMRAGRTDDGKSMGIGDIAQLLDTQLPGGLTALPSSFDRPIGGAHNPG